MKLVNDLRSLNELPLWERSVAAAFLVTIALAPLAYGGASRIAWIGYGLALGSVATALALVHLIVGRAQPSGKARLPIAAGLFGAVLVWVLLQATTAMPVVPHHPMWSMARDILALDFAGAVSLNPERTWAGLLRLLTAGLAFWIAFRLGRHPAFCVACLATIAVSGAVYSLYGLSDLVLDTRHVLFTAKDPYAVASYGNYVSATFINRNHFAAYAGIALLCTMALAVRDVKAVRSRTASTGQRARKAQLRSLLDAIRILVGPALLISVFAVAILLSMSRAGLATVFIAALALLLLNAARSASLTATVIATGMLVAGACLLVLVAGDGLLARSEGTARNLADRLTIYGLTLEAALNAPWLGHGYGTFMDLFPLYRDATARAPGTWNAAHNDYLELAATLGLPAFACFMTALGLVVVRCGIGAVTRRRRYAAPLAATAVTVQLGLHSLVDFPLQLDAIAITYAALLGGATSQAWSTRSPRLAVAARSLAAVHARR